MTTPTASPFSLAELVTTGSTSTAGTVSSRPAAPSRPETPPDVLIPAEGAQPIQTNDVPLTDGLPASSAMLRVDATEEKYDGHPCFRLVFQFGQHTYESRPDDIRQQVVPGLSLADISERRAWLADHDQVRGWWDEMARLRQWMQALRDAASVRLVVWDNTPYQIPWELYYLHEPAAEPRSAWLGGTLEIMRWTSMLDGPDAGYGAKAHASRGSMLLLEMLEPHAGGEGVADLARDFGYLTLDDGNAWLNELACENLRFALMMVHCHGEGASDANRFTIAGKSLNTLANKPMPALTRSRAVVILNACNTAKPVPVGPQVPRATRSFAEVFLAKGASAVIATVGPVDLDQTREFVYHLVGTAGDERRLSQLLLSWRRYHVDRLMQCGDNDPKRPGYIQDFFHAFMYVYFGHPDSTLEITDAADRAAS